MKFNIEISHTYMYKFKKKNFFVTLRIFFIFSFKIVILPIETIFSQYYFVKKKKKEETSGTNQNICQFKVSVHESFIVQIYQSIQYIL